MARLAIFAALAATLVACLPATPALALIQKTFVSSQGSGSACTQVAPCADFQFAHDEVAPLGEINCLDHGPYFGGQTQITKSVTIDCGGVTATTSNGFAVNGPGIVVIIRNLAINNLGIDFTDGAALIVENCLIANITGGQRGIRFRPSAPGAQLVVTDSTFVNNGNGATGGGIIVNPQSGGSAVVSLDRVTVANNVFGIVADGSGSTAGIAMVVANSNIHRNKQDGIVATTPSGGAPIGLTVKNTRSLSNNNGIRATGPGVTVRADQATVMHNATGLVVNNGASLLSFGTNNIVANGANGAFSGSVALQ